jgi:hypothetical protein
VGFLPTPNAPQDGDDDGRRAHFLDRRRRFLDDEDFGDGGEVLVLRVEEEEEEDEDGSKLLSSTTVCLVSDAFDGEVRFDVTNVPPPGHVGEEDGNWGAYARGAAWAIGAWLAHPDTDLIKSRLTRGVVGVVHAAPAGVDRGGISSSAAVGVAMLMALQKANGIDPHCDVDAWWGGGNKMPLRTPLQTSSYSSQRRRHSSLYNQHVTCFKSPLSSAFAALLRGRTS